MTMAAEFRLSTQRVMLTYKYHIDKEALLSAINEIMPTFFARAAHETADDEAPYEHTHVLIKFKTRPDIKNARRFDVAFEDGEVVHPHIKKITKNEHWDNAIAYIAKEDPDNADLLERTISLAESVWKNTTIHEALTKHAKSFAQVPGIIAMYNARPFEYETEPMENFRPWQLDVLNILVYFHERSVIWVADLTGGAGKSTFAKYLEDHLGFLYMKQMGGQYHTATVIKGALQSGWTTGRIVVDLTRSAKDRDIYDPIEALKDGRMTALKYQGCTLKWRPDNIVVFANFLPFAGKWSPDRYDHVYSLEGPEAPLGRRLNINELPTPATPWDTMT